jgi:hypothetical protein
MSHGDDFQAGLKEWIDKALPQFLNNIHEDLMDGNPWEMPIVEDYVLVVSVRDLKDDLGGIFTIGTDSDYKVRGLLHYALNR